MNCSFNKNLLRSSFFKIVKSTASPLNLLATSTPTTRRWYTAFLSLCLFLHTTWSFAKAWTAYFSTIFPQILMFDMCHIICSVKSSFVFGPDHIVQPESFHISNILTMHRRFCVWIRTLCWFQLFFAIFPLIAPTCWNFWTDLTGPPCISTGTFALEVHSAAAEIRLYFLRLIKNLIILCFRSIYFLFLSVLYHFLFS